MKLKSSEKVGEMKLSQENQMRRDSLVIAILCLFSFHLVAAPIQTTSQSVGSKDSGESALDLGSAKEYAEEFGGSSSLRSLQPAASRLKEELVPRGSEYISGYYRGAVLMPVRIWGAVKQPGLHHIPSDTDLLQLVTLAGGPNTDADLSEVIVKRMTPKGQSVIRVNLDELIQSSQATTLALEPNDIIVLPATANWISANTLTAISVVTSVVGIVASSVLIANQVNK
jgi:hypothetical protein